MHLEENHGRKYKLVAPEVDYLLNCFDRNGVRNPVSSTQQLLDTFKRLWTVLLPLATLSGNKEAKSIWIRIPRGTIEDYGNCYYTFEEARDNEEVENYEEYVNNWQSEYPEECVWYKLTAVMSVKEDGSLRYYGAHLNRKAVISALTEPHYHEEESYYLEDMATKLCELILPAVQESVDLLIAGKYNETVDAELPYQFRTGIITRADLRKYHPEYKDIDYDGLSEEMVQRFKKLLLSGANEPNWIGRIREFTANDFFKACKLGYEAIGKDCKGYSLPELYQRYADGRDEGLTGKGLGLNEGPGIDFTSSVEWDAWYNGDRGGGHPWEVVPGGNSTHMELYVKSDSRQLDYNLRIGNITQEEYDRRIPLAGYYFEINGIQRPYESVSFYLALSDAGLPVIIDDAEELLARFEATDYIGIVPHDYPTRYCESLFPDKYGKIIDFTHVYKDEDPWFEKIAWLPGEPAQTTTMVMI